MKNKIQKNEIIENLLKDLKIYKFANRFFLSSKKGNFHKGESFNQFYTFPVLLMYATIFFILYFPAASSARGGWNISSKKRQKIEKIEKSRKKNYFIVNKDVRSNLECLFIFLSNSRIWWSRRVFPPRHQRNHLKRNHIILYCMYAGNNLV